MSQTYIEPEYHHRYPRPYKPGPIPRTGKEWVPCRICTKLFVRRRRCRRPVTCQSPHCCHENARRCVIKWRTNAAIDDPDYWRRENAKTKQRMLADGRAKMVPCKICSKLFFRRVSHPKTVTCLAPDCIKMNRKINSQKSSRNYREKNRDKCNAAQARWRAANKDKIKAYNDMITHKRRMSKYPVIVEQPKPKIKKSKPQKKISTSPISRHHTHRTLRRVIQHHPRNTGRHP